MRRRIIFIAAAVTVLALALVAILVLVPRDDFDPPVAAAPTVAAGELTPQESTVVVTPRADGTVAIEQKLIFDAGSGLDAPVTWYVGGTQLGWRSSAREIRYGITPKVLEFGAREITATGAPTDLTTTVIDNRDARDRFFHGHRYRMAGPGPWSAGRHAVMINIVLSDSWVEIEGVPAVVLPLRFVAGPGSGQPLDLVRLTVREASTLECPATNINFSERQSCGRAGTLTLHPDELDQVEAVVVPNLSVITAAPIPVTERRT
jgi:hypothetical protein